MAAGQDDGDRGEARGIAIESFAQGGGQFLGAVVVQQPKESSGKGSGRFAALEGGLKKVLAFRDESGKARRTSRSQSPAFLFQQRLAMLGIFDELISIIGAAVSGEFG